VVALNTLYCAAILRRQGTAALVGGVLAALYGVLDTILKAEDSPCWGPCALVALSVTMVLTRRIHEPHAEV
jgi:inner membrane protein involved in colicin E2 resistance